MPAVKDFHCKYSHKYSEFIHKIRSVLGAMPFYLYKKNKKYSLSVIGR